MYSCLTRAPAAAAAAAVDDDDAVIARNVAGDCLSVCPSVSGCTMLPAVVPWRVISGLTNCSVHVGCLLVQLLARHAPPIIAAVASSQLTNITHDGSIDRPRPPLGQSSASARGEEDELSRVEHSDDGEWRH